MKRKSWAKTRDNNEPEIIAALRAVGASVQSLDHIDLLVGYKGVNYLLEVKNPEVRYRIEPSQQVLLDTWQGQYAIVLTAEEALTAIGAISEN